ncbi:hypothetical protein [Streptococcus catagoni]|uniref:hypothetical protein n=1 Tax=Streptococcus catagoni TaxID=2654874 RepID=UPI00140926A4|nr:hypothetical protein [Streptococcus catagoni]
MANNQMTEQLNGLQNVIELYNTIRVSGNSVTPNLLDIYVMSKIDDLTHKMSKTLSVMKEQKPRALKIISKKTIMEELKVSSPTIDKWESMGLKPYIPPYNDSRTKFYLIDDLMSFFGVEG